MKEGLPIITKGHVLIQDDLGNTLLDKDNAIHPQNMARVIARSLSNENNYIIHRIAFGNGGTVVDAGSQITYNLPNDGINDGAGYTSRLYNETYSEIIDDSNSNLGGGQGTNPGGDGGSTEHVQDGPGVYSSEIGLISEVVINAVLNVGEPTGQYITDDQAPVEDTESDFMFDEIALFTTGAPDSPTQGHQDVDVGNKTASDDTGISPLSAQVLYFSISVDGGGAQNITVQPNLEITGTGAGGEVLYSDLITVLNGKMSGVTASITDTTTNVQTFGNLRFTSSTTGAASTVLIDDETVGSPGTPGVDWLFQNIPSFVEPLDTPLDGLASGIQNDPTAPSTERERLLTHIIFSPVLKSANRTLTITYTLTVQVAQSA